MFQIVQTTFKPVGIEPVVIVGESTHSIKFRTVSVSDNGFTTVVQTVNSSGFVVKLSFKVFTLDGRETRIWLFCHYRLSVSVRYFIDRSYTCGSFNGKLFFSHNITLFSPWHIVSQYKLNLHKVFGICFQIIISVRYCNLKAGTRSDIFSI